MQKILQNILKKIKPTDEEYEKVMQAVKEISSKIQIPDTKIKLGGSGAKDTWLRNANDVDLYIRFKPERYDHEDISTILRKELEKHFKEIEVLHGSRDYFQIEHEGFLFELVPIINIQEAGEARNITDISPLHAEWVSKHKMGDEIRLTKAFCRGQGVYGAESYIQGFSGYVLEILTIYYGSFKKFIKYCSVWKDKETIDIEKHAKPLNQSKTQSPLIVIDPVQGDRNAAAALGKEKFEKLIDAAKRFREEPSEEFFEEKLEDIDKIKQKKNTLVFEITPLEGKKDVVGAKIWKTFEYIKRRYELNGFELKEAKWQWNGKANLWFTIKKMKISEYAEQQGPKLDQETHLKSFEEKHKKDKTYNKKGRIYAEVKREYNKADEFSKSLLKNSDVIKRVEKIRIL